MSEFKVRVQDLYGIMDSTESLEDALRQAADGVQSVKRGLRAQIRQRERIDSRLLSTIQQLETQRRSMGQIVSVGRQVAGLYQNTEHELLGLKPRTVHFEKGGKGSENTPYAGWLDGFNGLLNRVNEEKDTLSVAKILLGGSASWGGVGEAGVLKDVISYIESFSSFFTGDKKGLTGASDWCNLADSSIGVWTGLYGYYRNMYKGVKKGFFGDIAQKKVKVLGLSAGFLGLTSSILSASTGLDTKKWQSVVADYVDCGKDVISIVNSGYSLKHIGDVKSLSEMKAGPWSALNIYAAIGEAGVRSISQGFRSHERYYADGQWNVGDTGATGVDISIAGIYGISHKLTLGIDDLIFRMVDNVTGGNGTSDMSYFEKAAEGYKILENKCGEVIGNWWINLTKKFN